MVNVDDEILSNFNFSFKELQELVFSYKFIKNGNDYILKDLKSGETILNQRFISFVKFAHAWVKATMNERSFDYPFDGYKLHSDMDREYAFGKNAEQTYYFLMDLMKYQLSNYGQLDASSIIKNASNSKYKYAVSIARGLFNIDDSATRTFEYVSAAVPENDYSFNGVKNTFYKYKIEEDELGNRYAVDRRTGQKNYDAGVIDKAGFAAAWVNSMQRQFSVGSYNMLSSEQLSLSFDKNAEKAYNKIMNCINGQLVNTGHINASSLIEDMSKFNDSSIKYANPYYITKALFSNVNSAKRVDAWSRLVIPNASNKYNMELSEMLLDGHEYSEDIDIKNNDVIFNYGK